MNNDNLISEIMKCYLTQEELAEVKKYGQMVVKYMDLALTRLEGDLKCKSIKESS